jgi:hypothetical protein
MAAVRCQSLASFLLPDAGPVAGAILLPVPATPCSHPKAPLPGPVLLGRGGSPCSFGLSRPVCHSPHVAAGPLPGGFRRPRVQRADDLSKPGVARHARRFGNSIRSFGVGRSSLSPVAVSPAAGVLGVPDAAA